MNSVAEDIANMLEAESSLGLTLGDSLHMYREPAKPNNTVTVFEVPGMSPVGLLNSNEDTSHYERPAIQIRVRNNKPEDNFALCYQIQNILQARCHEIWGDYYYSVIYSTSNPSMLDWDASNRVRIVLNFNVQRRLLPDIHPITNFTATVVTGNFIYLTWDYTNIHSTTIIERSLDGSNYSVIATVGVNKSYYLDTDVFPDVFYYYRIRSHRGTKYSVYSFASILNELTFGNQYLIFGVGGYLIRKGVRVIDDKSYLMTDKTLNVLGFDGVEGIDWENLQSTLIFSSFNYFIMEFGGTQIRKEIRVIGGQSYFATDKTKTITGFDGVEDVDWENITVTVI